MATGVIGMDQWCHVRFPINFLRWLKRSQHTEQSTIESFCHAIAHWMIWCSVGLVHSQAVTLQISVINLLMKLAP